MDFTVGVQGLSTARPNPRAEQEEVDSPMQDLGWAWVEGNECLPRPLQLVEESRSAKLGFPGVCAGTHPHEFTGSLRSA